MTKTGKKKKLCVHYPFFEGEEKYDLSSAMAFSQPLLSKNVADLKKKKKMNTGRREIGAKAKTKKKTNKQGEAERTGSFSFLLSFLFRSWESQRFEAAILQRYKDMPFLLLSFGSISKKKNMFIFEGKK